MKSVSTDVSPDEEPINQKKEGSNDSNYQPKLKRPYDKLIMELSEEDLKSPGVHKLILSKSNELEVENYVLRQKDGNYRQLEIQHAAVSTELHHLKTSKKTTDNLYSTCLGSGTCLVGFSYSVYTVSAVGGIAVAGIGAALTVMSILITFGGRPIAKNTEGNNQ